MVRDLCLLLSRCVYFWTQGSLTVDEGGRQTSIFSLVQHDGPVALLLEHGCGRRLLAGLAGAEVDGRHVEEMDHSRADHEPEKIGTQVHSRHPSSCLHSPARED